MRAVKAVLILLLFFTTLGASDKLVLQLKWKHQFQFAGYYAALYKGYYRDAGLDVTILESNLIDDPMALVLSGKADYGVGNSDLLLFHNKGYQPVLLAVFFQHSPLALIARDESGINTPSDFVGKKILLEQNSNEIKAWLNRLNINNSNTTILIGKYDIQKLLDKKVDALGIYSTFEPFVLQRMGVKYKLFSPIDAGIDFYGDNLFTTKQEITAHPARAAAFREASIKGWEYVLSHKDEIVELIRQKYAPNIDIETLRQEADAVAKLIDANPSELGRYKEGRWRHIADTYTELGLLPQSFRLDGFFHYEYPASYSSRFSEIPQYLILVFAAVAAMFVLLYRQTRNLKAGEKKYRTLYEKAPLAYIVTDKKGKITEWNKEAEKIFGYEKDEVLQKKIAPLIVPFVEIGYLSEKIRGLLRNGAEFSSTNQNITKFKNTITCEWVNTPLRDDNNEIVGIISIARDVTEKEEMLAKIKESEKNFKAMLDNAPFPVLITDYLSSEVLFINQAAAESVGESKTSLMHAKAADYWVEQSDRDFYIKEITKKGYIDNYEVQFKRKDGSSFWAQMSATRMVCDYRDAAFIAFMNIDAQKRTQEALKESEKRYRLVAENAYDVIWTMEPDGRLTYISPSVERLRGYTPEEAIQQGIAETLTPESAELVLEGLSLFTKDAEIPAQHWELEQICKNGSTVWTDTRVSPIKDANGNLISILGITRDITEQKKLREALEIKNVAIEYAANGFLITDIDGTIEYINPAFTEITGYTKEDVLGNTPRVLKSGHQPPVFYEILWSHILSGRTWRGEVLNRRKNGEEYYQLTAIAPVKNDSGEIIKFVSVLQDISERKNTEARLHRMAHYDALTSLANRILFFEKLNSEMAKAKEQNRQIALMFIDLDGFKEINDSMGHKTGDIVLQSVAEKILGSLWEDDFAARIGGDEFTVLVTSKTGRDELKARANELLEKIGSVCSIDDKELCVGASIGVAVLEEGDEVKDILSKADEAMYMAKANGKNKCYIYGEEIKL